MSLSNGDNNTDLPVDQGEVKGSGKGNPLSQAGRFISKTTRTVVDKTKQAAEKHQIKEKTQELGRKTKAAAQTTGSKIRKFDEKVGFTNALTGAAVGVSANNFARGNKKDGAKALGVAGGVVATKSYLNKERM